LSIWGGNTLLAASIDIPKEKTKESKLELSQLITDYMVLQRGMENPLWGWAGKSPTIRISFLGETFVVNNLNEKERWEVRLPLLEAGGPYNLMIEDGLDTFNIINIMVGDVWLCAGQSNMELKIKHIGNHPKEPEDNLLRYFDVFSQITLDEQERLPPNSGGWVVCNAETVQNYSAVGYYFAEQIRKHNKNIALGLLDVSYSNSRVKGWISAAALGRKKFSDIISESEEKYKYPILKYSGIFNKNKEVDWSKITIDDESPTMILPNYWENQGLVDFNGFVWFQKEVFLTLKESLENAVLNLGKINESDHTYINGHFIGKTLRNYKKNRKYNIPAAYLLEGKNTISVRVEDSGGLGGIYSASEGLFLSLQNRDITLEGEWNHQIESITADSKAPTVVYNSMVHPLIGYGIKGVLWYQGEADDSEEFAFDYRNKFPKLVNDWRIKWGLRDLPFLCVQLPNFRGDKPLYDRITLRESQTAIAEKIDNVAQIITIDLGESDNNHPFDKSEIGKRLALVARNIGYEEPIICFGPTLKSFKIEGDKVIINTNNKGNGLMVKEDKYGYKNIKGFRIAGIDKRFYWAKAKIEDDCIIVWNKEVKAPVSIRYAWENDPIDANIYNKEGLPMTPFRLDNW